MNRSSQARLGCRSEAWTAPWMVPLMRLILINHCHNEILTWLTNCFTVHLWPENLTSMWSTEMDTSSETLHHLEAETILHGKTAKPLGTWIHTVSTGFKYCSWWCCWQYYLSISLGMWHPHPFCYSYWWGHPSRWHSLVMLWILQFSQGCWGNQTVYICNSG